MAIPLGASKGLIYNIECKLIYMIAFNPQNKHPGLLDQKGTDLFECLSMSLYIKPTTPTGATRLAPPLLEQLRGVRAERQSPTALGAGTASGPRWGYPRVAERREGLYSGSRGSPSLMKTSGASDVHGSQSLDLGPEH